MDRGHLDEIKRKLESYCAYQERCTFEVQQKVSAFLLSEEEEHAVIQHLKDNRFLNEQRFAEAFIQGKLRINKWGRLKIKAALQQKRVPKEVIEKAFHELNENEYFDILQELFLRKQKELSKEKDAWTQKQKILRFLASRGFTQGECYSILGD